MEATKKKKINIYPWIVIVIWTIVWIASRCFETFIFTADA